MKVRPDCYPCFFQQILKTSRMITSDEEVVLRIVADFSRELPGIPAEATPAEVGRTLYAVISRHTGEVDPYREVKSRCTREAFKLYPKFKQRIALASSPLRTATLAAIAGNMIDFGVERKFDLEADLDALLVSDLAVNHFKEFSAALNRAKRILYIADNAGETVFDRLLIEEMKKPVVYAVRGGPIINDATVHDAREAGVDQVAEVVSSGADAPGTILKFCSPEFVERFHAADLIISKGQGNYEALSGETRPLFFLLKAKCRAVARDIGVPQGSLILMKAEKWDFPP